jgi:predicted GNAT family acetyltransferase
MSTVVDNTARQRFEMDVQQQTVFADYQRRGNVVVVTHVEAPVPLRGTGAAGRFMQALLDLLRSRGEKVVPVCGYAAAWIRRHPEYQELLA